MQTTKNSAAKSALLFLTAAMLFAGCRPPGVRALLEGQALLEQGKFAQAAEALRTAAGLLNTNAQAFNYLGLACHQAGQVVEAEKAYTRALALDHDLTEAHYNLGCLLLSENRLEQAKAELTAYILRRGNSAQGWLKLGSVQLRLSKTGSAPARASELAAAEKDFEEALRLNPQSAEGLNGLGLVRLHRNHAADAASLFTRALKEQPDYRPALLNLAVVEQQNLNRPHVALQKYRAYLGLKPSAEETEAITLIVNQLEHQLAPPLSNNVAVQTGTNAPANKPVLSEPAHSTVTAKPLVTNSTHPALALKPEFNASLPKMVPTNAPSLASDPDPAPVSNVEVVKLPAEPVLKPAQDVVVGPPPVREVSAAPAPPPTSSVPALAKSTKTSRRTLLQRLNPLSLFGSESKPATPAQLASAGSGSAAEVNGSSEHINIPDEQSPRYTYLSPERPPAGNREQAERIFSQAVQAQQLHKLGEAIQDYQHAAELDPSFYDVRYNLGLAATEAGNLPIALNAYETALAIRPESLDARYNFALVLKQADYSVDAANELQKILASAPNESRAHLALGNLCAQQFHDFPSARRHYLKVLETDPHNPQADAIRYWLTRHPR